MNGLLELLLDLMQDTLSSAEDYVDRMVTEMVDIALDAGSKIEASTGSNFIDNVYKATLAFGISLIILKALFKGFSTYILWTDGDPDEEPFQLVLHFVRALAIAINFPTLYGYIIQGTKTLLQQVLTAASLTDQVFSFKDYMVMIKAAQQPGMVFLNAVFALIYLVMFFVLFVQFIMRGAEMLILKLGMPLACVGLLQSDKGVFANYLMTIFKSALTVVVQIFLAKISFNLMLTTGTLSPLYAIATLLLAMKTPAMLGEFMIATGGGSSGVGKFASHVQSGVRGYQQLAKTILK